MQIAPYRNENHFQWPLKKVEDKVTIFYEQTIGWQLLIAQDCLDLPHNRGGFAALHIVFSYFEAIAKYNQGIIHNEKAGTYFREGVFLVFPKLNALRTVPNSQKITDETAKILYERVRNSMFHTTIVKGGVAITRLIEGIISYQNKGVKLTIKSPNEVLLEQIPEQYSQLVIDPHKLIPTLIEHLNAYVAVLRDKNHPDHSTLIKNFESRFEFLADGAK